MDEGENPGKWSTTWSLTIEAEDKIGPLTTAQWGVIGIVISIISVLFGIFRFLKKRE